MVDVRSIDTFLIYLINTISVKKIVFKNNNILTNDIKKSLDDFCSFDNNICMVSQDQKDYYIVVDYIDNKIVIDILKEDQKLKLKTVTFFAFPSLFNTRYILNTSYQLYVKGINFYTPSKLFHLMRRIFLKFMFMLNIKQKNIYVRFDSTDNELFDLVQCHFYTGVFDSKRTITIMKFNNLQDFFYRKLSSSIMINKKIMHEYLIGKKFQDMMKKTNVLVAKYNNFVQDTLYTFDMYPSKYQRPFYRLFDTKKLFMFLNSLQANMKLNRPLLNKNFIAKDDSEFLKIFDHYKEKQILCGNAHGDMTPWNFYISRKKLYVFDFELFSEKMPICFDLLIFQNFYISIKNIDKFLIEYIILIKKYFQYSKLVSDDEVLKIYVIITLILYMHRQSQLNHYSLNYCESEEYFTLRNKIMELHVKE